MRQVEYLNLTLSGSKGCIGEGIGREMFLDSVRLLITKNGVTTSQTLVGGFAQMEEHLNKQLEHYEQQGWQAIQVERPEQKKQGRYLNNIIQCTLKRSIEVESSDRFNLLTTKPSQIRQLALQRN